MKRIFHIAMMLMLSTALSIGCSKEEIDDPQNPDIPGADANVPDPEGTVKASLRNNYGNYLGNTNIRIDGADNFTGGYFVSLGKVRGLGNVAYIPKAGWASQIAVNPGEGVVAYDNGTRQFYRIYVESYTIGTDNGIIGADIKYQTPFAGAGSIKVAQDEVVFGSEGGEKEIPFTNSEIVPVSVSTENHNVSVYTTNVQDYYFLPTGIVISAGENSSTSDIEDTVIIKPVNGDEIRIPVTVKGKGDYVELSGYNLKDDIMTLGAYECTYDIYINTSLPLETLKVSSNADWFTTEIAESSNALSLSVTSNYTQSDRSANVIVSSTDGKVSKTITITQNAGSLTLYYKSLVFNAASLSKSYQILTSAGFSGYGYEWNIDCSEDWITAEVTNDRNATISVDENTTGEVRTCTLTVYLGTDKKTGLSDEITITQNPHTFELNYELLEFDRQQQNDSSVKVTTSASEFSTTSKDSDWCTVSYNQNILTVRVSANDTNKNRTGTITIELNDGQKKDLMIYQSRYMVGDSYNEDNIEGIIFEVKGHHGKIVSVDEAADLVWSIENVATGATDEEDGKKNLDVIKRIPNWETLYPAFAWCDAKNSNGITGWYLPALNECLDIVKKGIITHTFWTSTESNYNSVYDSYGWRNTKNTTYNCRAVYAY